MSKNLIFRAGKKALPRIKSEGLCPENVKIVAGAAGGPKWLILSHLDRIIFSSWFKMRTGPLFIIGSSAGAWRFGAVSQKDPITAIERLQTAYISQAYTSKPTPEAVTLEGNRILNTFLDDTGIREILDHPYIRLNLLAVRCRGPVASEKRIPLTFGLAIAALCNMMHRSFLKFFFERVLFYDPRQIPPFFDMDEFPIQQIPLDRHNMRHALLASGSIPLVMSGVRDIPGTSGGIYRDGGVTDYHLDIPFLKKEDDGIVLFPHYTNRIIPGWFDKKLIWRKPNPSNMDNVLLVSPSREFISTLPRHSIPDRTDFRLFQGRDRERIAYWNAAVKKSESLGEAFLETVHSGKIRELVKPM
ncbi:patatin-like phospholipase family protein [Desulfonema magnum]|uniref:Acyltransferase/acyl hydrolase/lysophospholipase domain-containing protein n=1 Tax=Desulfonema magnum TaxID=45655 RepID=A0A975BTN7_9BACT|nr:patatin-like phospholipase family protein [Desulfonema magnum]QTA91456.1 acyltransferase/acyl hydrolase/lysophospholipase domain-containing protein [Desulfonema magnum]